jgi:hypothetical protein
VIGMRRDTVTIAADVYGLPGIAFGGYVAGLTARGMDGAAKVDLHAPAPFERALQIVNDGGQATLLDRGQVIAAASTYELETTPPVVPSWSDAHDAASRFATEPSLPFPNCFGCGPQRHSDKGLRVFVGPLTGGSAVAGIWVPSSAFATGRSVRPEFVWAALDCPGGWARRHFLGIPQPGITAYLAAHLDAPVRVGEPHLVLGWPIKRDGRKAWVGALIMNRNGDTCAAAEALWLDRPTWDSSSD